MADLGMAPVEGIRSHRTLALAGRSVLTLMVAFLVVWVLFIAHGTTFGSAVHDPEDFLITLLSGLTAAALYFVVASGFTLIFGLMRTVNMATARSFCSAATSRSSCSGAWWAPAAPWGLPARRSACCSGCCPSSWARLP